MLDSINNRMYNNKSQKLLAEQYEQVATNRLADKIITNEIAVYEQHLVQQGYILEEGIWDSIKTGAQNVGKAIKTGFNTVGTATTAAKGAISNALVQPIINKLKAIVDKNPQLKQQLQALADQGPEAINAAIAKSKGEQQQIQQQIQQVPVPTQEEVENYYEEVTSYLNDARVLSNDPRNVRRRELAAQKRTASQQTSAQPQQTPAQPAPKTPAPAQPKQTQAQPKSILQNMNAVLSGKTNQGRALTLATMLGWAAIIATAIGMGPVSIVYAVLGMTLAGGAALSAHNKAKQMTANQQSQANTAE